MSPTSDDLPAALVAERLALADLLESLRPEQWQVQTLCGDWTVHDLAAHLLVPIEGLGRHLVIDLVKARGNADRLGAISTERFTSLTPAELVQRIRDGAASTDAPPIVGILGPYSDSLIHGEDLRVPLGLTDTRPSARWLPTLDFLTSWRGRVGFVPSARPALTYAATDLPWTSGAGPRVEGPAAALALALTARTARLDELVGPGSDVLRQHATR